MVNLIVSGHGEFAKGLKNALSVIAGEFDHISFVNFVNDADKLRSDMQEIINFKPEGQFLVLTDLVGGTPFKTGAMISKDNSNVKVIGGVNLPMLLSIVYETDASLEDLINNATQSGKDGIKAF